MTTTSNSPGSATSFRQRPRHPIGAEFAPKNALGPPPIHVQISLWLWLALGLVQSIGNSLHFLSIAPEAEAARQTGSTAATQAVLPLLTALLIGAALVRVVPIVALAVCFGLGHGWARIVLGLIGSLLVLVELITLFLDTRWPSWVSMTSIATTLAASALMFTTSSNTWFRRSRRG